jgi:hypothetical protein
MGILLEKEVKAMNREEKVAEYGRSTHEVEEIQKDIHYQLSIELNKWRSH